jgi:amino acid permease
MWWAFCFQKYMNIRKHLPLKDKVFWKNFFQFIGTFIIAWVLIGYGLNHPIDEEPTSGGFLYSYIVLSFWCLLWLASKIAREFSELGKNEEYSIINGEEVVIKKKSKTDSHPVKN